MFVFLILNGIFSWQMSRIMQARPHFAAAVWPERTARDPDHTERVDGNGRRRSLPGRASEPARAKEPMYAFLYNCVLSRNIIPSSHLFLSPSRCILRSCVIARTPTLGLGHLRAKRLRRP